jgi:hypothetical protein
MSTVFTKNRHSKVGPTQYSSTKVIHSQARTIRLLSLIVLLAIVPNFHSQSKSGRASQNNDRVIIRSRRAVIIRRGALARQFPQRKTAIVTYPVVTGLSDAQALRRVRSLLEVKNVFDSSLDDYRQDAWLEEFSYRVNYNRNHILDITFTQSGTGAYPDTHTKHFVINLKDGNLIKAPEVFLNDKLESLATLVNNRLQAELKQILKENSGPRDDAENTRIIEESQEVLEFKVEDLNEFSVGPRGITFLYDAGYPHAIKAFEPNGRYFFPYSEVKLYIKREGPLGQFVD